MIVNYVESGWQITTQRAHGLLAGQICARWKLSNQPDNWLETLIATTEHDDVYNEFDKKPLLDDNGAPINFKDTSFELEACQKQIDMALTKSRFIALLISRHIAFTHGEDPLAKDFITELKLKEKTWTNEASVSKNDIDQAYELLEFCDAFSLLICQNLVPPENRLLEISKGPDGKAYKMHEQNGSIIVDPWPFLPDKFEINYETRNLKQLKFDSDDEFREALKTASVLINKVKISNK
ncbi:DUF3891 family protein [Pedobacter agri]|uniref:DUF3891 family protein n=1 Tax=Pedobacter agri TaxID=454586 RepID=A0A9X3DNG6_9SPHI|nr:DUF3891 family protein [Pedobacter agri]MCX3267513.1 DUF3891 family protein [Pedobacter agri]MDQ1142767.1 hypothetical protein [Pedobacter agri]